MSIWNVNGSKEEEIKQYLEGKEKKGIFGGEGKKGVFGGEMKKYLERKMKKYWGNVRSIWGNERSIWRGN